MKEGPARLAELVLPRIFGASVNTANHHTTLVLAIGLERLSQALGLC